MAKVFYLEDSFPIKEPLFTRSRKPYRGSRSSAEDNLEMNSLIVNFHRLQNEINSIEGMIDNLSRNLVGKISDTTNFQAPNDGIEYEISGVNISIQGNEESMILDTISKISGKIKRLESKIKRLENGK
jgi:tetrahydromethanopterin S-methyltransferase subunit B